MAQIHYYTDLISSPQDQYEFFIRYIILVDTIQRVRIWS